MLTLFTTCKPFVGDVGRNKYAALETWTRLEPRPEVLLLGDDHEAAEVAVDLGLVHIPIVERHVDGKPLVSSLFRLAFQHATSPLLCYLDADVLLLDNGLIKAARALQAERAFVAIGASASATGFDGEHLIRPRDFRHNERGIWGMDYFLFRRDAQTFTDLPPFPINAGGWDNWLIYSARRRGMRVINATALIHPVHLDHPPRVEPSVNGYHHLLSNTDHLFSLMDCTHRLTADGLERTGGWHTVQRLTRLPTLHPPLAPLQPAVRAALAVTRRQRERAGLTVNGIGTRR